MNAILGRICEVASRRKKLGETRGAARLEVSFKPLCVMPGRGKPPEWIKDQTLKVVRTVRDPREVGGVGDSILLTPMESAPWLSPLVVNPSLAYGQPPQRLRVSLRWWKDAKPGPLTVSANGHRRTFRFRKAGKQFAATVPTKDLFPDRMSLPAEVAVRFEKLAAGMTIMPEAARCCSRVRNGRGVRHRIEGDWYSLEAHAGESGGGISSLREQGRGLEHFPNCDDWVGNVFDYGGHVDVAEVGWGNRLDDVEMTAVASLRDGPATRLALEGVLSEDRKLHTTASFTLLDDLPLVLLRREVLRHKGKAKKDDKDDKSPRERVDDVVRVALGFRSRFALRKEDEAGGRVLSVDDDRFAVVRCAQTHDQLHNGWRLTHGWVVAEHPGRQACMMYLFDGKNAPVLGVNMGHRMLTLESRWLPLPVGPESGTGFALALTAGEVCGADPEGAWVATRRPLQDGGVECVVIGRWRSATADPKAVFRLGARRVETPLERMLLPGVGSIRVGTAVVRAGRMSQSFSAVAGGVPARRPS